MISTENIKTEFNMEEEDEEEEEREEGEGGDLSPPRRWLGSTTFSENVLLDLPIL